MKEKRWYALTVGISAREALGVAGAALLGAAAFPPVGLWPCSLASIVLFLFLIRDHSSGAARPLGLLYGFCYGLGTMHWLFGVFGVLAVSLVALMAAYFGLLATLIGLTRGRPPWQRAALAALFAVAVEWLRGDAWYLRFPWYTAPHALAAAPAWIASVRWLGVYGLSSVVWFIAAAGVFNRPWLWAAFLFLPVPALNLPGFAPPDRRALLIQTEELQGAERLIPKLPAEPYDLAVLPEYSYLSTKTALKSQNGPVALARKVGAPVVFGAGESEFEADDFENVAAVIDADGNLLGTFPKQRPVPLFHDGVPGRRRPVFPVEQGVLGVAVCYDFDAPEIAASLVRQGATVLVAPTFDAMSWGRIQHDNHELLLRLRAVENDRWILRAASSGRSEAVDPHGVPSREGVEVGATGTAVVAYGHRDTQPLGGQLWFFGPLAALGSLVTLAASVVNRIRTTGEPNPNV